MSLVVSQEIVVEWGVETEGTAIRHTSLPLQNNWV